MMETETNKGSKETHKSIQLLCTVKNDKTVHTLVIKTKDLNKVPCDRRETAVKRHEKRFTPHIICTELMLYEEKSLLCQFDVKLSIVMYIAISTIPETVVSLTPEMNHLI